MRAVPGNRTSLVQHSAAGGTDTTTAYTYDGNGAGHPAALASTTALKSPPRSPGV